MLRYIFLLLSITFIFTSCEDFLGKTIEIDEPEYDAKLVLHEYATDQDTFIQINLSKNVGIFQSPDVSKNVEGALITLTPDGSAPLAVSPIPSQPFIYLTDVPTGFFQVGQGYRLNISHVDFEPLTAYAVIPQPPQIDSVVFRENGGVSQFGDPLSSYDVYISDPAGIENFYEFRIENGDFSIRTYPDPITNEIVTDTIFYGWYPRYLDEQDDPRVEEGLEYDVYVSDAFFDGEKYLISIKTYRTSFYPFQRVRARAITRDHYLHKLSLKRAYNAQDNPLAEPVAVYTNLTNGIGAFTLSAQRYIPVR